ncbi:proteoglycan 4-like [Centruroides sculpturatus]|uniref:proteoglycan 4-like n=1 Tax=Centruroides sculpturatus TaxID=218467 RepID=UPI000C6E51BA|nr:proteoglycan 4-like [Centruroides sculpturatus]
MRKEYRRFPEERLLLPNDHVIVECTYDSSKKNHTTFGGLSTHEEMCLAFLSYYPKQNISAATSCPIPSNVLKSIGVEKLSEDEKSVVSPLTGKNESYYDFLDSYSWDEISVNQIQKAMMYGPHINFCLDTNGKGIKNYILSRYPKVKRSYKEPDICASRENPIRDIPPRTKPSRPITPKIPEITLPPRNDQTTRIPQKPFPPKRTTQMQQTNSPPNVRPETRKPQRKFPPIRPTTRDPWRTTQMQQTDFPATRKPQRKFPPVRPITRDPWRTTQMQQTDFPATRKPQRKFPPVRTTTRNPPWKPPPRTPSSTRKPYKPFPPNVRQDRTTERLEITTDKPKSEIVPHVIPYPIIEQIIRESG